MTCLGMAFGLAGGALAGMVGPVEAAKAAEHHGFVSITFGEHTHIPVTRRRGPEMPAEMVQRFASQLDPFVAMTAAAVATSTLEVGTGVTLVPEHHPISMAKAVASVDQVSRGRVFLGIGAAWNDEVENHGVKFEERWAVTRERVEAMRVIWRSAQPEFHGEHVNFDPIWSDPKPVQAGGPPILMGSNSRQAIRRAAAYCDGWMPTADDPRAVAVGIQMLAEDVERAGRDVATMRIEPMLFGPTPAAIESLLAAGVTRIHVGTLDPVLPGGADEAMARLAEVVKPYR
jgi:probable F420-dependent oxidoreductase